METALPNIQLAEHQRDRAADGDAEVESERLQWATIRIGSMRDEWQIA